MTELAPGIPMPEHITVELNVTQARSLSFLLQEQYHKWGMEFDHYVRQEDVYPAEVLELLDTMDAVGDQLRDQGIEWDVDDT